jgi:hypothetical protein
MDDINTSALIAKGREMYGLKIRCTHNETTLVQHDDPEFGWFACYQCERCGAITRREVTADDLDVANNAPWLDVAMYEQATTEQLPSEKLVKALAFFGRAAK